MASGDTGNVVPGNRLRVRIPCPPLGEGAHATWRVAPSSLPAATYSSKVKMRFQSSLMLMTVQPRSRASAIRAFENVPMLELAP
jgi:hypothetical protein